MIRRLGAAIGIAAVALALAGSTRPVAAAETVALPSTGMPPGVEESWTWNRAGREAITWGVCGAVGAAGAASLGTPTATAAALVGGAAGAAGGFLTYASGQAYDAVFGDGDCLSVGDDDEPPTRCNIVAPDTALD